MLIRQKKLTLYGFFAFLMGCVFLSSCHTNSSRPENSTDQSVSAEKKVVISVLVLADGSVGDAKILESSGDKNVDDQALDFYTHKAKYIPAQKDGKPIDSWKPLVVKFKLNKPPQ